KKGKWMKVLRIIRLYGIYFFVWFGASTLMDYLFFEEVIDNQVIRGNLWTSPFMALFFMILNETQKEDERESPARQIAGEKE
ncbi:MAG TPA: hypothetical protein VLA46_10275, partial [Saprospiraceae bacterium]|nr:hypothetical protein [Saprospiraceae bacterium]